MVIFLWRIINNTYFGTESGVFAYVNSWTEGDNKPTIYKREITNQLFIKIKELGACVYDALNIFRKLKNIMRLAGCS